MHFEYKVLVNILQGATSKPGKISQDFIPSLRKTIGFLIMSQSFALT